MSPTPPQEEPADGPFADWNLPDLDGVDDLSAEAFRVFLSVSRRHFKAMFASMAGSGTHPGQAMCLRMLVVNDGASQRDVARMLHVAPPTVSRMLQGMEKAGLVERRPDATDQRLTRVYLTEAGRERGEHMGAAVGEYVNATFATLSEDERRELARLLHKLEDSIARTGAHGGDVCVDDAGDDAAEDEA